MAYSYFLGQWFFRDDTAVLTAAKNPDPLNFLRVAFSLPYWRPMADFYFLAMYQLFEMNAMPYHVANVTLHGATAVLTALLVRRVARSLPAGVFAGVLFAVAPAYGQGVVWISTAGPILATLFSLTTMLLFLRYLEREGGRGSLALAVLTFFVALSSMEASICIPAVLLLLGLAVSPPGSHSERKRFAAAFAPFVVLGVAYAVMQAVGSRVEPTAERELSLRAFERLGDRALWLSLPLSSADYGSWTDRWRWVAFAVFAGAALVALLRGQRVLPALFASAVIMLGPSSLQAGLFQYRWVYNAAPLWAGFVAVLAVGVVRWLADRHILVAGAVIALLGGGLAASLLPHQTGVQRGMAHQAAQMEDIKDAIEMGCPGLRAANTVFILPLPIVDPPKQNVVLSLIYLLKPGINAVRVGAAAHDPPSPDDCVLEARANQYVASRGSDYVPNRFWTLPLSADCPGAVPWQRVALWTDQLATVKGPVVDVIHVGAVRGLLIGENRRLRVQTAPEHSQDLVGPETYLGKIVCVRGVVRTSLGSSSIAIDDPRAIVVE